MENTLINLNTRTLNTAQKLGFSKLEAADLIEKLNKLISSYNVFYQKLRNYHWNVTGADFFELHEKFEVQYNTTQRSIDDLAERVRVFGYNPTSTMKDYLENSEIHEPNGIPTSLEMVKDVLSDIRILMKQSYDAVDVAITNGDRGTENMLIKQIEDMEKVHWMLTAFSKE